MNPIPVDDVTLAFPANAERDLMPPREECEAGLAKLPKEEQKKWREFQRRWFFEGLPADTSVSLKEGIDGRTALRHLGAIQGSFAPAHEHKEACVAYLASQWFHDVKYEKETEQEEN